MKKLIVMLLLHCIFLPAFSQNIDSIIYEEGRTYYKQGNYYKAIGFFTDVIEISSDSSDFRFLGLTYRGWSKEKLTDYRGAIQDITSALEMSDIVADYTWEPFLGQIIEGYISVNRAVRSGCRLAIGDIEGACHDLFWLHSNGDKNGTKFYKEYCTDN